MKSPAPALSGSGSWTAFVCSRGRCRPDEDFDLVLANLPYVAEVEWASLQPEVTEWEPRGALLAGPDGLDAFRVLIPACGRTYLRTAEGDTTARAPVVGLEVGEGQAEPVGAMLREAGFGSVEVRADLAGIDRVVIGRP